VEQTPPSKLIAFDLLPPFHEESDTGSVRLGTFEAMYERLFAEALEAGEAISEEERERLNLAAAALGLDADRVARLEAALLAACEARADITLVDPEDPSTLADRAPPSEVMPSRPPAAAGLYEDDEVPTQLRKKIGAELREPELQLRYEDAKRGARLDDQLRIAAVLVQRGAARPEQRTLFERHRSKTPIRPMRALTQEAWQILFHPEEDHLTGEIFGVIASAALVGRVSAMRRDGTLPRLDPEGLHDPASTTVSAVRALAWSAAALGMRTPPIFVAPELDTGLDILTAIPPTSRIGARALSGLSAQQLAFACGRHMSWYREEHFVCTLVPSVSYLEDIFLAALLLGDPRIPLQDTSRAKATVIAEAMEPCLEKPQRERLSNLVASFMMRGGATHLKRWARAAEWTSLRAGLLLCGDLEVATHLVRDEARGADRVKHLEEFWASDAAGELRRALGASL
jgi:hypothetical protein